MKRWVVLLSTLFLTGCAGIHIPSFPSEPKQPEHVFKKTERKQIKPEVFLLEMPDGKQAIAHIAYSEDYEYNVEIQANEPKQSFFQKIWGLFGWWVIILGLLCVFIPGFASLLFFGLNRVRRAAGDMVSGIEDFLKSDAPEDAKKRLLDSLRGVYNSDTKKFVSEIKHKKRNA